MGKHFRMKVSVRVIECYYRSGWQLLYVEIIQVSSTRVHTDE